MGGPVHDGYDRVQASYILSYGESQKVIVYMIFSFDVADHARFAPYGKAVMPVLMKHGAEVLVADFDGKAPEGSRREASVVIKFPSEENAMAFYRDPEYAPLKKLRLETTTNITVTLAGQFVRPA